MKVFSYVLYLDSIIVNIPPYLLYTCALSASQHLVLGVAAQKQQNPLAERSMNVSSRTTWRNLDMGQKLLMLQ